MVARKEYRKAEVNSGPAANIFPHKGLLTNTSLHHCPLLKRYILKVVQQDSQQPQVKLLSCKDVTQDSFSMVLSHPRHHSSGTGLGSVTFTGHLEPWQNFQQEVRAVLNPSRANNSRSYQHGHHGSRSGCYRFRRGEATGVGLFVPISHDEQSIEHGGPTPSVSVRECMLYLMVKSRQDREFPSQSYIALDDWVHDKYTATAEKPGPRLKHITEAARGPKKSENPKPRDSQPRGRGALGSSNQQNAAQSANPRGAPSTMESSAQRVNPQGAPSSRHPMETRGQAKGKSEDNKERKR
ncbi:unnamed protein product [Aspergillus oryzae]|nr:unnamed protein product [Aspergillus oryzae]